MLDERMDSRDRVFLSFDSNKYVYAELFRRNGKTEDKTSQHK